MEEPRRKRPMPWYPGPKLDPFQFPENSQSPRITFVDVLGYGLPGVVVRVKIGDKFYALKAFKFYHWSRLSPPNALGFTTIRDIMGQFDPFNCECRAYGRLDETGMQHLAPRCYGYVILPPAEEQTLSAMTRFPWTRWPEQKKLGIRALVKEIVTSDIMYDGKMLGQMRKDLLGLHHLGIVVYDLKQNYLGGKIIDFSQARVVPHRELDLIDNLSGTREVCWRDMIQYDGIVTLWNENHPEQPFLHTFLPNSKYWKVLRSGDENAARGLEDGLREVQLIAAHYDWKAEKKLRKLATAKNSAGPSQPKRVSKRAPKKRRRRK